MLFPCDVDGLVAVDLRALEADRADVEKQQQVLGVQVALDDLVLLQVAAVDRAGEHDLGFPGGQLVGQVLQPGRGVEQEAGHQPALGDDQGGGQVSAGCSDGHLEFRQHDAVVAAIVPYRLVLDHRLLGEGVDDLQRGLQQIRGPRCQHHDLVPPLPVGQAGVGPGDLADAVVQELVQLAQAREVGLAVLAEPRVAVDVQHGDVDVGDGDVALQVPRRGVVRMGQHQLLPQLGEFRAAELAQESPVHLL